MAVPTLVGTPSSNSGASGQPSITLDAGIQANDFAIWVITIDTTSAVPYISFPAGWTKPASTEIQTGGDGSVTAWAYRVLDGTETSALTATAGGGGNWASVAMVFRGASGLDVYDSPSLNSGGHSAPWSASASNLTTTVNDTLLLYWFNIDNGSGQTFTMSAPTGYGNSTTAQTSNWSHLNVSTSSQATAGATGNVAGTIATGSGNGAIASGLIAIAPSSGGASGAATDTSSVSDSAVGAQLDVGASTDTSSVSDSAAGTLQILADATDTSTVTDSSEGVATFVGGGADSAVVTDVATGAQLYIGDAVDSASVTDSALGAPPVDSDGASDDLVAVFDSAAGYLITPSNDNPYVTPNVQSPDVKRLWGLIKDVRFQRLNSRYKW